MLKTSLAKHVSLRGLFYRPWQSFIILLAFVVNTFGPLPIAKADDFRLPAPGVMVRLSPPLDPPILKGIKVHTDNPFRFDFILDKGDSELSNDQLKEESSKLIKYFLASLTIPEKDLWVNLSPYEKDRIIPNSFGLTEMGRDLLAEDYMLKQITASLIYPEDEVGKKFWKRIYEEAAKRYGTTNIPVSTFNKVWIVPEKAVVYENAKAGTAYVVESKLKVMLEQDYLSLEKHQGIQSVQGQTKDTNQLGSQIVREIVIPELTKEVNENKNFAKLRQVYNSLILATWYKKKIKDSILEQVYADKNKTAGVNINDPQEKERIYQRYLQAFKKGVYNYIKEDIDPLTQETIPRKYFSGGVDFAMTGDTKMDTEKILKIEEATSLNVEEINRRNFTKKLLVIGAMLKLGGLGLSASVIPAVSPMGRESTPQNLKNEQGLTLPAEVEKYRFAYKERAKEIFGGVQEALEQAVEVGPIVEPVGILSPKQEGKENESRDMVFVHLQRALKAMNNALDNGGDQEILYEVADALASANRYDARKVDTRLKAVNLAWKNMQKIYLLNGTYDPSKPTILFVQAIGIGPFPVFNGIFKDLEETNNIAVTVSDFLRPIDDNADMLNTQVKEFEAKNETKIAAYIPLSYGFSVFVRALQKDSDEGLNTYRNAHVVALSPMIGGMKQFKMINELTKLEPINFLGSLLGLNLPDFVMKEFAVPNFAHFIDAIMPNRPIQRDIDEFIQQKMLEEKKIGRLDILLPPSGNDRFLDYKNSAYLYLLNKGLVRPIDEVGRYPLKQQHHYLPSNPEAREEIKLLLERDRAMKAGQEKKISDAELDKFWDSLQNEYIFYHGTSGDNLESIKKYGLDPLHRPYDAKDVEMFNAYFKIATGQEMPFPDRHKAETIYLTARLENVRVYAQAGPEVMQMMLSRIPQLLSSDLLNSAQKDELIAIQAKYQPYMDNHKPVILKIKGRAFFTDKKAFIDEFRRREAGWEQSEPLTTKKYKSLLLLGLNNEKVGHVNVEDIEFPNQVMKAESDLGVMEGAEEERNFELNQFIQGLAEVMNVSMNNQEIESYMNSEVKLNTNDDLVNGISKIIALPEQSESKFNKSEYFRQVMTEQIVKIIKEIKEGGLKFNHNEILFKVILARIKAARLAGESAFLRMVSSSLPRLKGQKGDLSTDNKTTEDNITPAERGGDYKGLYAKIAELFGRNKAHNVYEGEEINIGETGGKYKQLILKRGEDRYDIWHVGFDEMPYVRQHLSSLAVKILDPQTTKEERYKLLAEYEWWFFQANPIMRGGAAIGDAISIIMQALTAMPLRQTYEHTDFDALSLPLDEYIQLRVHQLDDQAMKASVIEKMSKGTGGIDLTPANMNLQTQNAGEGIKFHIDAAMLQQLQNAPGFVPVIINIQPMNDLREFLGLNQVPAATS